MQKTTVSSKHMLTLIAVLVLLPLASILFSSWEHSRVWGNWRHDEHHFDDCWQLWVVMGASCIGFGVALVVGLQLLAIRSAGKQALQSRVALLHDFAKNFSRLPNLVLGIGLTIALGLVCIVIHEVIHYIFLGFTYYTDPYVVGYGAAAIVLVLWYCLTLRTTTHRVSQAMRSPAPPLRLAGKSFTEAEYPLLWAFVREVAAKAETVMPETIVLGIGEGFFVTEQDVELAQGERHTGRTLYLSLPYLMYMSRGEAAAIIGHELGHFTGEDAEYSLRFSPFYARVVNILNAAKAPFDMEDNGIKQFAVMPLFRTLGDFFLSTYGAAIQHWSRERELTADQQGALAGGAENLALALLRIAALAPRVNQALGECRYAGMESEDAVLQRVQYLVRKQGLDDPTDSLQSCQSHPTDRHPSTSQRLHAIGIEPGAALVAQAREGSESPLLDELGLKSSVLSTPATTSVAFSADLEAKFIQATKTIREIGQENFEENDAMAPDKAVVFEKFAYKDTVVINLCLLAFFIVMLKMVYLWAIILPLTAWLVGIASLTLFHFISHRHWPLLTLSPTGFQVADMQLSKDKEIPWLDVKEFWIKTNSRNMLTSFSKTVVINFRLKQGASPVFASDRRATWHPRSRKIEIKTIGLRPPLNTDMLEKSITALWQSAQVRQAAQELE